MLHARDIADSDPGTHDTRGLFNGIHLADAAHIQEDWVLELQDHANFTLVIQLTIQSILPNSFRLTVTISDTDGKHD